MGTLLLLGVDENSVVAQSNTDTNIQRQGLTRIHMKDPHELKPHYAQRK